MATDYGAMETHLNEIPSQPEDGNRNRSYVRYAGVTIATVTAAFAIAHISSFRTTLTDSFLSSLDKNAEESRTIVSSSSQVTVDTEATEELSIDDDVIKPIGQANALLMSLKKVGWEPYTLFGHENSNREGQYFWDDAGLDSHSDIFNTTGQWPGLYGYSFEDIIKGKKLTNHVLKAASQGAVISFMWEANNPVTGGGPRDCQKKPCEYLLPGKIGNDQWVTWMDQIVHTLQEFKIGGVQIPIILRLFHENTEGWYWWGTSCCDAESYKAAWNYTRWYLTEKSGMENIVYIYAPAKVSETYEAAYTEWYPGNDLVDIIGFDRYAKASTFKNYLLEDCRAACNFSMTVGKPCAAAEIGIADGIQMIKNEDWYMSDLLENVMSDDICKRISYMLTWSNESPRRYWVPLPENPTAKGFIEFAEDTRTLFQGDKRWNDIRDTYGYGFKDPDWDADQTHDHSDFDKSNQMHRPNLDETPVE